MGIVRRPSPRHPSPRTVLLRSRDNQYRLPDAKQNDKILEVLHDIEFRNIITLKWVIITDLLEQNKELEQIIIQVEVKFSKRIDSMKARKDQVIVVLDEVEVQIKV